MIDQRISTLEEENASSSLARGDTTSNHERRIAALEAQIYALQLGASQAPAVLRQTPQIDFPHQPLSSPQHSSFGNPPTNFGLTSPSNGHSLPPFQQGGNSTSHNRYGSSSSLKHEVDSQGGGGDYNTEAMSDYTHQPPAAKRWKGDEGGMNRPGQSFSQRPDFISRGVVTEEEAAMCYDS